MSDHPTGCVECDLTGAPVEGMTMICDLSAECRDIFCLGHRKAHRDRVHAGEEA